MNISRTHSLYFNADIDIVFPLFTPEEESKWVEGWEPDIILSQPEHTGTIFSTRHANMPELLWVLSRYDVQHHIIQYVRFAPGHHVGMLDLAAKENTQIQIMYTLTSLSDAGAQYIRDEFSEEAYLHRMHHWHHGITRYLKVMQLLRS